MLWTTNLVTFLCKASVQTEERRLKAFPIKVLKSYHKKCYRSYKNYSKWACTDCCVSSVSILTLLQAGRTGSCVSISSKCFIFLECPERFWEPFGFVFNGCRVLFLREKSGRGMKFIIRLHLVRRLKMLEDETLLPHVHFKTCILTTVHLLRFGLYEQNFQSHR